MNVLERMQAENTKEHIQRFMDNQKIPYPQKKYHAMSRVVDFYRRCEQEGYNFHVSVGGLDSIVLYMFINFSPLLDHYRYCIPRGSVPGISASYLEDPSIIRVHKALGIECVKPMTYKDENGEKKMYTKTSVIEQFGFPVLSKEIATKIETLQHPTDKNKTVRHAIITGETGAYGGYQKNSRMKIAKKWLELFGGYENETEGTNYGTPDFQVSAKCCYYLKEQPCDKWAKEHHSVPFLGLMASEGGRREKALKMHGCNYWGKTSIRSCPFAIFNRQDLLKLALEMDDLYKSEIKEQLYKDGVKSGRLKPNFEMPESIIPKIYGKIVKEDNGELKTTKAQRTGCSMCGFGIHLEKRPHRFDLLRECNQKQWDNLMYHLVQDDNGDWFGWAKVLDYIGVDYL